MIPAKIIAEFDEFLAAKKLQFDSIVIGGTALALLGVITRETRDCDVLHPALPPAIRAAASEFAATLRRREIVLDDHWLNEGPSTLTRTLPSGWLDRTQVVFQGKAIILRTLGREELLMSKLFALCDRGIDIGDCLALKPTSQELKRIVPWLKDQDGNPGWPDHVNDTLRDLERKLGHEL